MNAAAAPLPVPPSTRQLILFGGSFDPVHLGHTRIADAVRARVAPGAWIVFVPAGQSPHKGVPPVASGRDRADMLRAAVRSLPGSAVWVEELSRPGPSFWIDTLRRAASSLEKPPGMRFLIGADQAAQFHCWKDYGQILQLAEPIVLARPPWSRWERMLPALGASGAWSARDLERWRGWFFDDLVLPVSATQVRAWLAGRDPAADAWLDPEVLRLIETRGLYRRPPPAI